MKTPIPLSLVLAMAPILAGAAAGGTQVNAGLATSAGPGPSAILPQSSGAPQAPASALVPTLRSATISPGKLEVNGSSAAFSLAIEKDQPGMAAVPCGVRVVSSDGAYNSALLLPPNENPAKTIGAFGHVGQQSVRVSGESITASGYTYSACRGGPITSNVVTVVPEVPTLVSLQVLKNGKGAAANEYIEDVPLIVAVSGDRRGPCGFRVMGENLVNHNTVKSPLFTDFGNLEAFAFKGHTQYRVTVAGEASGDIPACKGQLSKDISVINDRAWLKDMKAFGHLTYAYDQLLAYVEFGVQSIDIGDGKSCTYELTGTFGGSSHAFTGHYKGYPIQIDNGKGMIDGGRYIDGWYTKTSMYSTFGHGVMPTLDNRGVVTIRGVGASACNGGEIKKTLVVPLAPYLSNWDGPTLVQ